MLDGYHILTLTHRHSTLENIGQMVLPAENQIATLEQLKADFGWDELLYLATCNRVMFLFYSPRPVPEDLACQVLRRLQPSFSAENITEKAASVQLLHGVEAVRHILEVAASMDSLVVGEREILRQLRLAYDHCYAAKLTGDHLRLLMRFTIETAKEIYTTTGIGQKAVSVVALAFQAMQQTGLRTDSRILLVGAGETNTLFGKFLKKYGFQQVTVFNRTFAKAEVLAQAVGGQARTWADLENYAEGFDALVVCTGATTPIITTDLYARLLGNDTQRKVVIDLSVPNNVDAAVPALFNIQYIEIEGLKILSNQNLAFREHERELATGMLTQRIYTFRERWHERQVERSLAHIPDEIRAVKDRAFQQIFAKEFEQLDATAQDLVHRMLNYMEKGCVTIPIKAAKAIALQHARPKERSRVTE